MSKPKILIIDDEPVSSLSLEALLSGQGYELIFADHGATGLAMAKAELPDLVLLDVMMPDMDGYEVCRQMRGHETLAEVPILMITALDDQLSRLAGLQAGADDFLVKPFNAGELRARVGTITRLNRYRRLLSQSGQLQWLMDNSQEGYMILDSRSRVSYANIQARNYLGLPEQGSLPALDFFAQANKHYRFTPAADSGAWNVPPIPSPAYMVRPETQYYGAFWLSVKEVPNRAGPDAGRLIQLHDCTEDMSKHIALGK
ncbi:MAG: response regulator, partial [Candidatus Methylumidiphilus sp.]